MSDVPEQIKCMEVWGGNEPADRGVSLAGLDAVVHSTPVGAGDSGGDVHYLSSCATGRITRILLADVSGHGEIVASTARTLRDLMRRFINFADQSRLVVGLNRAFSATETGGRFATAIVATYWAPTGQLMVSNAGHPRPMVYRARRRAWSVLDREAESAIAKGASDIPLGIDEDGAYTQFGTTLERGDVVMFYTDALIEAQRPDGAMLTEQGLLALLNEVEMSAPWDLKSMVLQRIEAFRGGGEAKDDTTILLLTPNDSVPRAGIGQGLLASVRIARASFASLLGRGGAMPLPQMRSDVIGGAVIEGMNGRGARGRR